jgi:ribosome-binding factor A
VAERLSGEGGRSGGGEEIPRAGSVVGAESVTREGLALDGAGAGSFGAGEFDSPLDAPDGQREGTGPHGMRSLRPKTRQRRSNIGDFAAVAGTLDMDDDPYGEEEEMLEDEGFDVEEDFAPYRGGRRAEVSDEHVRDLALRMRTSVDSKHFGRVRRVVAEAEAYHELSDPSDPLFVGPMIVSQDHEHFILDPYGRKSSRDKIHARKVERMQQRLAASRVAARARKGEGYRREAGADMTIRQERVSKQVQDCLEEIFSVDLRNHHSKVLHPLFGRVSVDEVVVSRDMKHAEVRVSGMTEADNRDVARILCFGRKRRLKIPRKDMPGMNRAARRVRHLLALKLGHMQHSPELSFVSSADMDEDRQLMKRAVRAAQLELRMLNAM